LLRNLAELFTIEEIETLGFELGVHADDLQGDTRNRKAASLVDWAERNNRLVDLTVAIAIRRPNAKWE
jgi:hypothetical protein